MSRPCIAAWMLTCRERNAIRERTLARLSRTDWSVPPDIELTPETPAASPLHSMSAGVLRLLQRCSSGPARFILLLEDDLSFNRHLRHNIERWLASLDAPPEGLFFATLFNPSGASIGMRATENTYVVDTRCAYGSQALLFSTVTARHMLRHWDEDIAPHHDFRMYRLATLVCPIYCHTPSLVQHVKAPSTWGGPWARAPDFIPDWRAP